MELINNKEDFSKIEMPILSQSLVLYEVIHKQIYTFPKYERYTLGEKIQEITLSFIELIIIANSSNKYEKEKILLQANSKIEIVKILMRIALNCNMIIVESYLDTAKRLQEIGKMTQGWIKYVRNTK